ncbi:MAG: glycosyltransferase [Caldilineaceae bacterium]
MATSVVAPRFSIVIPTYQRCTVVVASVRALAQQEYEGRFEVIVVVDGSTDGSAQALRALEAPFPLTVIEQPNQGAATARNQGAAAACGEILLFLDDDMTAHPRLLAEHDRSHGAGADVVLGDIPLHPGTPSNLLSERVKSWAERRAERLATSNASLTLHDLLTGQISLRRTLFAEVGGFDTQFTLGGSFGNEDIDFGYRLQRRGCKIVFNPAAISWQYYVVGPRQYLRQWYQAGQADVVFARKHPEQAQAIFTLNHIDKTINRYLWRPLLRLPWLARLVITPLCWLAVTLVTLGSQRPLTARLFAEAKAAEYWRGVQDAGGVPDSESVCVLAYHAIADLAHDRVLARYAVPPAQFRRQLEQLQRAGYHFIHPQELLALLKGRGKVPKRALLLTFDDCYEDLLTTALPVLLEQNIPALAFAVSQRLGGVNEWDREISSTELPLLDSAGLHELSSRGVEIGAHSRTHRSLPHIPVAEMADEIAGSVQDLAALGFNPCFLAYPYGESNAQVEAAAAAAGLEAAFTIDAGMVHCDQCMGEKRFRLPRIEIQRDDVGWKLWWKLLS